MYCRTAPKRLLDAVIECSVQLLQPSRQMRFEADIGLNNSTIRDSKHLEIVPIDLIVTDGSRRIDKAPPTTAAPQRFGR
jgi:hypothetical protein